MPRVSAMSVADSRRGRCSWRHPASVVPLLMGTGSVVGTLWGTYPVTQHATAQGECDQVCQMVGETTSAGEDMGNRSRPQTLGWRGAHLEPPRAGLPALAARMSPRGWEAGVSCPPTPTNRGRISPAQSLARTSRRSSCGGHGPAQVPRARGDGVGGQLPLPAKAWASH